MKPQRDKRRELIGLGNEFECITTTIRSFTLYREEILDTNFQKIGVATAHDLEVRVGDCPSNNMTFRVRTSNRNIERLTGHRHFYHYSQEDQTKALDELVGKPIKVYLANSRIIGAEILPEE